MSRRHDILPCEGETIAATLDEATGNVGLLIVTGGNEVRAGAFGGQTQLAARVAAAGYPVLRFDRRGVGDSSGNNAGFRGSGADIAAALAALRTMQPQVSRVVVFGNCDAASALALGAGCGADALVLANPWTFEAADQAPPPAAVRARYAERLRDPRAVRRLLTGGVSLGKLAAGVKRALSPASPPSTLLGEVQRELSAFEGSVHFLLAGRDRTAQAFMAAWPQSKGKWQVCDEADHSFSTNGDWLFNVLLATLEEQAGELDVR